MKGLFRLLCSNSVYQLDFSALFKKCNGTKEEIGNLTVNCNTIL